MAQNGVPGCRVDFHPHQDSGSQVPLGYRGLTDLIQMSDISFNGQVPVSATHPITHSLLGQVDLSEALGHATGDIIMSPVSRDSILNDLSPGHNSDSRMITSTVSEVLECV